ncbi:membrane fusion protein, multidrug efflux system [Noviherbaspirillum humi]|uniref:Membrane fusion protein, multidrug efflux system n=1 Tax=Noviherbaspirillum humi TaxID=1688639 RepID=A0A239ED09_9BURK|nr:efflux RND transporter periplasmic adaptor subunit [Noviherbaspirillum humi]SNS42399.1 membrane fusion protein, multidrug efflux system [Noviherbaspirillum humi]
MSPVYRLTGIAAAALIMTAVAGCGEKAAHAQAPGNAPPPPEVAVVTVTPERLAIFNELPGRLEATRVAQVRARVPGIVQKRAFREGSDVKAGDVLYRIDPSAYQATLNSAEATVARAEANLAQANMKAQRYKPLVETNAISKQEYDDAVTATKQATADLAAAKATRETARLNLGYATITAPISGRIGRSLVTEGALVGQGEATLMATIQQLDPIYVNLTQSSTELARLQQALRSGQLKSVGKDGARVTLVTEDGKNTGISGKLLFSDVTVEESTGSVILRAEFPNSDRALLPGMYARARIEQAVDEQAITVPQQAVQRGTEGAYVMLVGADGKVAPRPIKTGTAQGNKWIITDGLKGGEKVIVEGLQKVKPGAPARAVPWQAPAAAQGGAPAAQPAKQPAANAAQKS